MRISDWSSDVCSSDLQSDNVRSLNQVMPIIATFRATVVPVAQSVRDDFNGHGKSDLLWRSLSSGSNVIWRSAGSSTTQAVTRLYGSVWTDRKSTRLNSSH